MSSPDKNVEAWTATNASYTDAAAPRAWAQDEITWGVWSVPEREVAVLPDVAGLDVAPAQLDTARRMQEQFGLEFPLVEARGEDVPLPDASFDLALSEFGASIWADPEKWIPEAARLLRPGGVLIFMRGSTLAMVCTPVEDEEAPVDVRLQQPLFGMYRFEWSDGSVEFHPPTGETLRLLRSSGFEVEDLVELQAPEHAVRHPEYDDVAPEWGRRWPAEEIWVARKRHEL